jgi:hypothetical protein
MLELAGSALKRLIETPKGRSFFFGLFSEASIVPLVRYFGSAA